MVARIYGELMTVLALLCACGFAAAAQPIVVEHDSRLLASPSAGARVVASLKKGTIGELLVRKGAWVNIKTSAGTGWVNSFNVREQPKRGAEALSGIVAPPRKRATTATIGIRGLDAEDLRRATYNARQLQLLEKYAVTAAEAEDAARESGLDAVRVEYLDK